MRVHVFELSVCNIFIHWTKFFINRSKLLGQWINLFFSCILNSFLFFSFRIWIRGISFNIVQNGHGGLPILINRLNINSLWLAIPKWNSSIIGQIISLSASFALYPLHIIIYRLNLLLLLIINTRNNWLLIILLLPILRRVNWHSLCRLIIILLSLWKSCSKFIKITIHPFYPP